MEKNRLKNVGDGPAKPVKHGADMFSPPTLFAGYRKMANSQHMFLQKEN